MSPSTCFRSSPNLTAVDGRGMRWRGGLTWRAGLILLTLICPAEASAALELSRAYLAPPLARAERKTTILVEIRNPGPELTEVEIQLVMPHGMDFKLAPVRLKRWKHQESQQFSWEVTAASPLSGDARVEVNRGSLPIGAWSFPVRWHAALQVKHQAYVPAPVPANTGPYLIGAIHCPLWGDGRAWKSIEPFPDREPALGWYDEGTPEVTDWEIKWALDHGISFFLTCWYRDRNSPPSVVKPALDDWLHKGLPESRYGKQLRFALMFENGHLKFHGEISRQDLLDNLLPFWIKNYFNRPNYLLIDGSPLFAIYDVNRFISDLGGPEDARAAIDAMRSICRDAGFEGLYLLGQSCWGGPEDLKNQVKTVHSVGMDNSFAYHWPTFTGVFGAELRPAAEQVIMAQQSLWQDLPQPSIPTLSMGWDSEPWGFSQSRSQWRLNPAEFKLLCQRAKALIDRRGPVTTAGRLILLDNWNEFGEGHYLMPTRGYGFGHLNAVREVFAPISPPSDNRIPEDLGLGPYDSKSKHLEKFPGKERSFGAAIRATRK